MGKIVIGLVTAHGLLHCNVFGNYNFPCSIPLNDYKLLACDIQQLLVAVTIHACSSSGSQYFRVIEDLIVLLGHLQNSKNTRMQSKISAYCWGSQDWKSISTPSQLV